MVWLPSKKNENDRLLVNTKRNIYGAENEYFWKNKKLKKITISLAIRIPLSKIQISIDLILPHQTMNEIVNQIFFWLLINLYLNIIYVKPGLYRVSVGFLVKPMKEREKTKSRW